MANPVIINLTANEWGIVATGVTAGQVHKLGNLPNTYLQTYRMTGNAAPTEQSEGVLAFLDGPEIIDASAAIDVYIMPLGANGKVRVDVA